MFTVFMLIFILMLMFYLHYLRQNRTFPVIIFHISSGKAVLFNTVIIYLHIIKIFLPISEKRFYYL